MEALPLHHNVDGNTDAEEEAWKGAGDARAVDLDSANEEADDEEHGDGWVVVAPCCYLPFDPLYCHPWILPLDREAAAGADDRNTRTLDKAEEDDDAREARLAER